MSRNLSSTSLPETDEEKLAGILAPLRRALELDLSHMEERSEFEDFNSYENYNAEVKRVSEKYKKVQRGFRRIVLVPTMLFAVVTASRMGPHFMHSKWCKTSKLSKMVNVYGVVSAQMGIKNAKADA